MNICDINSKINSPVVTIGSFDGVHFGHLSILEAAKREAKRIGGESVVITFSPHPRVALGKDCENLFFLNSAQEKSLLLERAGIDNLIIINFTKEIASLTMEQFFTQYIKAKLGAKSLVVGYNHRFGSDYNSDFENLTTLAERENINLIRVDKQGVDERDISSTTIRNLLKMGDFERANRYLSHPYLFIGDINSNGELEYDEERKLYPKDGIYDVEIEHLGETIFTKANVINKKITFNALDKKLTNTIIYFTHKSNRTNI